MSRHTSAPGVLPPLMLNTAFLISSLHTGLVKSLLTSADTLRANPDKISTPLFELEVENNILKYSTAMLPFYPCILLLSMFIKKEKKSCFVLSISSHNHSTMKEIRATIVIA